MKRRAPSSSCGLFPLRFWAQVPLAQVQAALRAVFTRWGCPQRVRVDHGWPWGSEGDLPPALALWFIGLGIGVIWNPPGHPQANGVVERIHGLLGAWGEPATCPNFAAWERRLRWIETVQRERYPIAGSGSRLAAFPTLAGGGRPYETIREADLWNLGRVDAYLSQGVWRRRVDKTGRITLYNWAYGVGRRYARQEVLVRFAPQTHEWVVYDAAGDEVARHPAHQIRTDRILALDIAYQKPSRARRHASQTS
jgi:hypothetical protein